MKTVVLLLSLSFSLLLCNGQSIVQKEKSGNSSMLPNQDYQYVSILNLVGIWSEIYNSPEPVYPDTKITTPSYERFTISGEDTIINGIIYKKLYMFYDSVFIKSKATAIGGIREDENKKVYYKGKTIHPLKPSTSIITNNGGHEGDEVLLYDFGIKIGDTLKIDNLTFPDEIITVASIDTVLIGNTYRKEFSFKYGNIQKMGLKWIEGIGSTKGLLFTSGDTPTNGLHNDLICFKQNNQTLYFNNSYSSCFPDLSNSNLLNVDAGNDTTYCSDPSTTAIPMGIKVNIQNGVAPYTYAWECIIIPYGIFPVQTASDILNDSTLQSPTLTQSVWLETKRIKFIVHVTDNTGNTGKDSIQVAFSHWGRILGYEVFVINKGDSVLLNAGKPGGRVASYSWTPREGLSTPDSSATWCKPSVSTDYYSVLVDTSGCTVSNLAYQIRVNQTRSEFAPIGATWYYSQNESYNPPQANYIKHISIKDSTINDKPVRVIQKTRYQRSGATNLGYEYLYQHGDTIFYWKNNAFHVLYNFSLAKGDSMRLYSEMPDYCENKNPYGWVEVDSVYSTMINNHLLKSYSVIAKKGSKWDFGIHPIIEKIGSLTYLIPQNNGCITDMPGIAPLRCYSDPELGVYFFVDLPCDTITTFPDAVNLYERNLQVKVYPNPVTNDLFIEGNFNEKEYTLELYSIQGNLIKTECMEGGINLYRMDAGTFKSGSYILRVISQKGRYAERMVIKR